MFKTKKYSIQMKKDILKKRLRVALGGHKQFIVWSNDQRYITKKSITTTVHELQNILQRFCMVKKFSLKQVGLKCKHKCVSFYSKFSMSTYVSLIFRSYLGIRKGTTFIEVL